MACVLQLHVPEILIKMALALLHVKLVVVYAVKVLQVLLVQHMAKKIVHLNVEMLRIVHVKVLRRVVHAELADVLANQNLLVRIVHVKNWLDVHVVDGVVKIVAVELAVLSLAAILQESVIQPCK